MSSHFKHFITLLEKDVSDKIVSIIEFGSRSGELNPHLSDIDLLIIAKTKQDISFKVSTVRKLEKEVLKVSHSTLTQEEEEKIFGSLDFTGVHLIAVAKDEIDEKLQPKSLRLKIIFRLILSKNMFIYHLEFDSKVLLGKDLFRNIPCQKPTFTDRVKIFVPLFFILSIIPFVIRNRRKFRIWCFKVTKWLGDSLEAYAKINYAKDTLSVKDLAMDTQAIEKAKFYIYNPFIYKASDRRLYLETWLGLLKALPFFGKA